MKFTYIQDQSGWEPYSFPTYKYLMKIQELSTEINFDLSYIFQFIFTSKEHSFPVMKTEDRWFIHVCLLIKLIF